MSHCSRIAGGLLLFGFLSCVHVPVVAQLPDVKRIVFVGDSITHAGGYVSSLEAAIITQHPERRMELINVGLPSETVSGLSEPGHAGGQFPRPDLHERLGRVLEQTKPDLVVACYGMNDGIYYPLGDDRFAKFKSGIERLHKAVVDRGAKIIHLTPAFFDSLRIKTSCYLLGWTSIARLTSIMTKYWSIIPSGCCPNATRVGKCLMFTKR